MQPLARFARTLFAVSWIATAVGGIPARAAGNDCVACCKGVGLVTCPTRIRVFGDGSLATQESGGWRVIGIWWLDCDQGATFQSGGTVVIPHRPVAGEVLLAGYPPTMIPCFREHCGLPADACLAERDQRTVVTRCSDGTPLSATEMKQSRSAAARTATTATAGSP